MSKNPKCPLCDTKMDDYAGEWLCSRVGCSIRGLTDADLAKLAARQSPPEGSVKVRIAVGVESDGRYLAHGSCVGDEVSMRVLAEKNYRTDAWITAYVQPLEVPEVQGEVETA